MVLPTSRRDTPIKFQRDFGVGTNDHGDKVEDWRDYCQEWAAVRFGTSQERREAAQQRATQSATFRVLANPDTRALTPLDRITGYLGSTWEIIGVAPFAAEVEITAIRVAA